MALAYELVQARQTDMHVMNNQLWAGAGALGVGVKPTARHRDMFRRCSVHIAVMIKIKLTCRSLHGNTFELFGMKPSVASFIYLQSTERMPVS